jgi:hypothetical protein
VPVKPVGQAGAVGAMRVSGRDTHCSSRSALTVTTND